MFFRVLSTEFLKIKRTLALWMVLIAPAVVLALQFMIAYQANGNLNRPGTDVWGRIVQNAMSLWTILMMPMFITLETSLLAGMENTDKNWKSLLALPVPRWMIYAAKFTVTVTLLWTAHAILITGTMLNGALLKALQPALKLGALSWTPVLQPMMKISLAALFGVAIQHWVSLRWQTFTAALGFGMCAMVAGFIAVNSAKWGPWYPWSMPMHVVLHRPDGREILLAFALGGAAVSVAAGCWEFVRREIG